MKTKRVKSGNSSRRNIYFLQQQNRTKFTISRHLRIRNEFFSAAIQIIYFFHALNTSRLKQIREKNAMLIREKKNKRKTTTEAASTERRPSRKKSRRFLQLITTMKNMHKHIISTFMLWNLYLIANAYAARSGIHTVYVHTTVAIRSSSFAHTHTLSTNQQRLRRRTNERCSERSKAGEEKNTTFFSLQAQIGAVLCTRVAFVPSSPLHMEHDQKRITRKMFTL